MQRLPTYAKRAPDASSKSAVAAASPANQLHGGFHELMAHGHGLLARRVPELVEVVDGHVDEQRVRHQLAEARLVVLVQELRVHDRERHDLRDRLAERREVREVAARLADHEEPAGDVGEGDLAERRGDGGCERLLAQDGQARAERLLVDDALRLRHGHVHHGPRAGACGDLGDGRAHGDPVEPRGTHGGFRERHVEVDDAHERGVRGVGEHADP